MDVNTRFIVKLLADVQFSQIQKKHGCQHYSYSENSSDCLECIDQRDCKTLKVIKGK
jgi:hypothetical protein